MGLLSGLYGLSTYLLSPPDPPSIKVLTCFASSIYAAFLSGARARASLNPSAEAYELCWGYIGMMEDNMEIAIIGYIGVVVHIVCYSVLWYIIV